MSYNIGDIVRIGSGKVEYSVDSFPAEGQAFVIGEKSSRTVETTRLILVKAAESVAQSAETFADVMDRVDAYTDGEDDFDPRTDRRQSAYGLAILAQIMRKNAHDPRRFLHNSNPLKPIGSKRAKVRKRVKAQRFVANNLSAQYNTLVREGGYSVRAA